MINGILNVYKEKGYTSHDVVACLRKITGQKKIGHTGTLDPDAEGVLPVCLGRATKVCDMLTDRDKTYEAVLLLGKNTDTQDISGTVTGEWETDGVTEAQVEECIRHFVGEYEQVPPMYSAVKVGGRKLYELAREGKTVERKARKVAIYEIRILEMELPRIRMEVTCSKGTYIRTLCHDIGGLLGVGGCMEHLTRIRSGRFLLSDSRKLSDVEAASKEGRLEELLIPLDEIFADFKKVTLDGRYVSKAYNGNPFLRKHLRETAELLAGEKCRVYDTEGRFIAVYRYEEEKCRFVLEKMFFDREQKDTIRKELKG